MSYSLTEEQQLIGQGTREFIEGSLQPVAAAIDRSGNFPQAEIDTLAACGYFGLLLPESVGGAETGFVSYVHAIELLAGTCASVSAILNAHTLAACAIQRWGTEAQRAELLPALASGEQLAALAATDIGPAGIPPARPLRAMRHGSGFVLNGSKAFVRNAGVAGLYLVFAATDKETSPAGLTAFILGASAAGLRIGEKIASVGLRGATAANLDFENVQLPESAVLGAVNGGGAILAETLALAAVADAAQTVGIVQAALQDATSYAKQRIQFGRPIGDFQAVQSLLANVAANCHATRLAVFDTAAGIEQAQPFQREAAMVRLLALNLGQRSLIELVQVEGGYGYSEEMNLARLYRDIACSMVRDTPADFPEANIAAELG